MPKKQPKVIKMPGRVRTKRGRNRKEDSVVLTDLRWTRLSELGGMSQSGCLDVSLLIKRSQIHDRISCKTRSWHDFPSDRCAYVGVGGRRGIRFIAIGHKSKKKDLHTQEGETIVSVSLPWEGCGRDLAELCGILHLHAELREEEEKSNNKKKKRA